MSSVKIMLSYDYCHFEICLSSNSDIEETDEQIDDLRKRAQRLADKAVEQYKLAKQIYTIESQRWDKKRWYENEVEKIKNKSKNLRSEQDKAMLKVYEDRKWDEYIDSKYDYQDDWDESWLNEGE